MAANDERLRVVCAGAGYFAAFHHAAWAAQDDVELVAIADPQLEKAEQAVQAIGQGQAVSSLEAALDLGGIDLCDIASPPDTHLELIDRASAAGCSIICQKPFAGGLKGGRGAVALAKARKVTLAVHENFRFQPWWRRIRQEIDDGRIGGPFSITFHLRPGDGQGATAYLARQPYFQKMERFLVHETAVHLVDVFRFLFGEPAWVWADLRRLNPAIAGEDAGIVVMGFDDDRRAVFDGNRLADHRAENRRLTMGEGIVEGDAGTLRLSGDGEVTFRAHGANDIEHLAVGIDHESFGGGCVAALQRHVVDALRGRATLENSGEDYLRNLGIVDAIYRSAETGTRIERPFD